MKRTINSITACCLFILFSACMVPDLTARETRDLDPFTGIGIAISADVYYTPGNTHEITIEGNSGDVKDLISRVENGYLKIKYDDWRVKRSKLTIYITCPELEKVNISGSAKFKAEAPVSAEEMGIKISGSGSIIFGDLNCDELEVNISGSGNALFEKGNAEEMDVKISGSGKVLAEFFKVSECSATISGSGSCKITVSDELEAKISGSGSIYYHGDPQIHSSSSGSGKVRSL